MEIGVLKEKAVHLFKKYRYVLLILVIGIIFMLVPSKNEESEQELDAAESAVQAEPSISEELAGILEQIDGAGNVRVLLTVAAGEETIYQTDDDISVTNDTNTTQIDTVVISDTDRNQAGLIRQVNPPTYLGAIVVCQGADSPRVKLAIVEAISKVTGLGVDRISVLKMK